jgi:hypothetical protein
LELAGTGVGEGLAVGLALSLALADAEGEASELEALAVVVLPLAPGEPAHPVRAREPAARAAKAMRDVRMAIELTGPPAGD